MNRCFQFFQVQLLTVVLHVYKIEPFCSYHPLLFYFASLLLLDLSWYRDFSWLLSQTEMHDFQGVSNWYYNLCQSALSISSAYANQCDSLKSCLWANAASLPPFVLHFGFTLGGSAWNVCPPAKKLSLLTLSHKVPLNFCGTDLEEFSVLNIPRLEDTRLNCWRTWVGHSWVTCVGF